MRFAAGWAWGLAVREKSLATRNPASWKLEWNLMQRVGKVVSPGRVSLERTMGPCGPMPTAAEEALTMDVDQAVLFWGGRAAQARSPGPVQKGATAGLLAR